VDGALERRGWRAHRFQFDGAQHEAAVLLDALGDIAAGEPTLFNALRATCLASGRSGSLRCRGLYLWGVSSEVRPSHGLVLRLVARTIAPAERPDSAKDCGPPVQFLSVHCEVHAALGGIKHTADPLDRPRSA